MYHLCPTAHGQQGPKRKIIKFWLGFHAFSGHFLAYIQYFSGLFRGIFNKILTFVWFRRKFTLKVRKIIFIPLLHNATQSPNKMVIVGIKVCSSSIRHIPGHSCRLQLFDKLDEHSHLFECQAEVWCEKLGHCQGERGQRQRKCENIRFTEIIE